jgi:hypothetical protein
MEEEYSPAELIEERQRRVDEMNGVCVLPKGTTTATELEFFEAVYLNENLPLGYRLKAARRASEVHPRAAPRCVLLAGGPAELRSDA